MTLISRTFVIEYVHTVYKVTVPSVGRATLFLSLLIYIYTRNELVQSSQKNPKKRRWQSIGYPGIRAQFTKSAAVV